jgi:hypothetical protein
MSRTQPAETSTPTKIETKEIIIAILGLFMIMLFSWI